MHEGINAILHEGLKHRRTELVSLDHRLDAQLHEPDVQRTPMRDFARTRLMAAQIAAAASRLEVKARGGRAYRLEYPANRRLREAAFLAIQAPTEAQLEFELARAE